jgi:hypothetical protein
MIGAISAALASALRFMAALPSLPASGGNIGFFQ